MNTSGYIVRIMHTNRQLIRKKGRFYDSCNTILNRLWNGLGISGSICSLLICLSAQLSTFVYCTYFRCFYVPVISPLNKTPYFRHKYFHHMDATWHGTTLYSVGTFCLWKTRRQEILSTHIKNISIFFFITNLATNNTLRILFSKSLHIRSFYSFVNVFGNKTKEANWLISDFITFIKFSWDRGYIWTTYSISLIY